VCAQEEKYFNDNLPKGSSIFLISRRSWGTASREWSAAWPSSYER